MKTEVPPRNVLPRSPKGAEKGEGKKNIHN